MKNNCSNSKLTYKGNGFTFCEGKKVFDEVNSSARTERENVSSIVNIGISMPRLCSFPYISVSIRRLVV